MSSTLSLVILRQVVRGVDGMVDTFTLGYANHLNLVKGKLGCTSCLP